MHGGSFRVLASQTLAGARIRISLSTLLATPATFRTDAPTLGEHNETLLRGFLGLSAPVNQALIDDGIICDRQPPQ